jgi:hypothetical protein
VLRPLAGRGGHGLQEWSVAVNASQVVSKASYFSSEVEYEVINLLKWECLSLEYEKNRTAVWNGRHETSYEDLRQESFQRRGFLSKIRSVLSESLLRC